MQLIKRIAIFVFSIYGFFIFVLIMLLLLPFFIIALLLPHPLGGNIVYKLAYIWALLFFFFTGISYREVYKYKPRKNQSYIFVTNHISYMDIPMMILATRRFPVRILAKSEMGSIPIFGFIYNKGAITVNRKNAEDRRVSIEKLMNALSKKISILICPEGTFNMTEKPLKSFYDGAFRIAVDLKIPILPVIFPDTYDRLNYKTIFSLNPGKCRAIFLDPVQAQGENELEVQRLKLEVYSKMEKEILKLKVNWIR